MNKALFMIKRKLNKAISSCMSMEDKIDFSVEKIDMQILKFGEARTDLIVAGKDTFKKEIEGIEKSVVKLYEKKKELLSKKKELIAKESYLKAQISAMKSLSFVTSSEGDFTSILTECDAYLKELEAQLDTASFLAKLKD